MLKLSQLSLQSSKRTSPLRHCAVLYPPSAPAGDECFIITAARSHFSRDPSEYFENVLMENHPYGYHPRGVERFSDRAPRPGERRWTMEDIVYLGQHNTTELIQDFRAQHKQVLEFYAKWFSTVFRRATHLNILSEPFDLQRKFSWIHGKRCSALVLRSEDSRSWEEILSDIFPGFKMPVLSNSGKTKWYSEAYKAFKGNLTWTRAEISSMCRTETERHFYKADAASPCRDLR